MEKTATNAGSKPFVNLIIKSNIKQAVKDLDKELRISADLAQALNKKAREILLKAVKRTKSNHRTTVMPQDL